MKLAQLLDQLNELAKERPEALEMEVVYSRDDEGNGFQLLGSIGGIGCYDTDSGLDDFIFEEHYKDDPEWYNEEGLEFKPNAICIN